MLFLRATPDVIAGFVAEAQAAPEELSTIANVMTATPMPFLPAEQHGKPVVMAFMTYAGDVADDERVIAPRAATAVADLSELSAREREVLEPVAEGMANEQIAERLFLSTRTVERHLSNVYAKLRLSGKSARAAAAARFSRM
jgi:DNA-binding NarL/FixJ family response regulator